MTKLKLGTIPDDTPVKLSLALPAALHRDLIAYAEALSRESGAPVTDPARLIVPMIAHFMAGDRAFAALRRAAHSPPPAPPARGSAPSREPG